MIKIIGATDAGKVRNENQDAFAYRLIGDNWAYAFVCDGMGGEKAGDVASVTACQLISKFFTRDLNETMSEISVKSVIISAISAANAKVYSMAKENPEYKGMGTTLALAVIMNKQLHVVNIGDSRVYQVFPSSLKQLTRDHTVVQSLIDRGEIDKQQAASHPQRHYITRAVGVNNSIDIDYQLLEFNPDSKLLICSDGLSGYITEETLPPLLEEAISKGDAQPLINFANQQGGNDNVTAVIIYQE